jgi:hypothetical protein
MFRIFCFLQIRILYPYLDFVDEGLDPGLDPDPTHLLANIKITILKTPLFYYKVLIKANECIGDQREETTVHKSDTDP